MSDWPSCKAKKVRKALAKIGWRDTTDKKGSSHKQLIHPKLGEFTWSLADSDAIGRKMLSRIAKHTGLTPEDLCRLQKKRGSAVVSP